MKKLYSLLFLILIVCPQLVANHATPLHALTELNTTFKATYGPVNPFTDQVGLVQQLLASLKKLPDSAHATRILHTITTLEKLAEQVRQRPESEHCHAPEIAKMCTLFQELISQLTHNRKESRFFTGIEPALAAGGAQAGLGALLPLIVYGTIAVGGALIIALVIKVLQGQSKEIRNQITAQRENVRASLYDQVTGDVIPYIEREEREAAISPAATPQRQRNFLLRKASQVGAWLVRTLSRTHAHTVNAWRNNISERSDEAHETNETQRALKSYKEFLHSRYPDEPLFAPSKRSS